MPDKKKNIQIVKEIKMMRKQNKELEKLIGIGQLQSAHNANVDTMTPYAY